jgi:hypothetical protein
MPFCRDICGFLDCEALPWWLTSVTTTTNTTATICNDSHEGKEQSVDGMSWSSQFCVLFTVIDPSKLTVG